jgi:hypothetical protein
MGRYTVETVPVLQPVSESVVVTFRLSLWILFPAT